MLKGKSRGLYEAGRVVYLPVDDLLLNCDQPRKNVEPESLRELTCSIARYGILQPLTARRRGKSFELISGERRLKAAKLAGLSEVPCIILHAAPPETAVLALVENLQRRDLDFIEEALSYSRLINLHGLSQEELARQIGRSQSAVANKLRLLKLSKEILFIIRESGLSERHARALLRLDSEADQVKVLEEVINRGLNVSNTEEYIDGYLSKPEKQAPESEPVYIIKDLGLFKNSLSRNIQMLNRSGVEAVLIADETEEAMIFTVKIIKK
jgi:ParB family chromosome partitioning protein